MISTSQTTFDITGSNRTGEGLTGTITASPNPVYQGKDETITYGVTNKGNENIVGLNVKVLIVDPDTQEVKTAVNNQQSAISTGETITGAQTTSTLNLTPKVYLAILQAYSPQMTAAKTLGSTMFEVKPGLEVTKTIPDIKNILVWLNYQNSCQQSAINSQQECVVRLLIEQALNEAGVNYYIVTDKKDFQTELRNPYYTDFLILGDHHPIEDHFAEELREQIYSGKGLISSMFNRQNLDSDLFGIKVNGHLSNSDYPVNFLQSGISEAGTLQAYGRALNIEAINLSENMGWISETSKKGVTDYPVVIKRSYGNGNVLFFAFDLGLSIQNYDQFATLLKNSLNFIHKPTDGTVFYPEQLIPIEIKVESLGGVFDIRVTEIYPSELKLYYLSTAQWITEKPWTINMHLEPNAIKTLLYYALTPDTSETYLLQTEVGYVENGTYNFFQNLSAEIKVNKTASSLTSDIIVALNALQLSGQEKAKANNAIRYVQNVQNRPALTASDTEANINDMLKAVDSLLFVTIADISDIRLMMDELLCVWEGRFYLNRFTQ